MGERAIVYTPDTLAKEWGCSGQHIRNLIKDGRLKAFRLGKLFRIPQAYVEEFVCQNIASSSTETSGPSPSSMNRDSNAAALLARLT